MTKAKRKWAPLAEHCATINEVIMVQPDWKPWDPEASDYGFRLAVYEPDFPNERPLTVSMEEWNALNWYFKEHAAYVVGMRPVYATLYNRAIRAVQKLSGLPVQNPRQRNVQASWSKQVKRRDGYVCQQCGSRERLEAHHIVSYWLSGQGESRIDNGITLCYECHHEEHRREKQRQQEALHQ